VCAPTDSQGAEDYESPGVLRTRRAGHSATSPCAACPWPPEDIESGRCDLGTALAASGAPPEPIPNRCATSRRQASSEISLPACTSPELVEAVSRRLCGLIAQAVVESVNTALTVCRNQVELDRFIHGKNSLASREDGNVNDTIFALRLPNATVSSRAKSFPGNIRETFGSAHATPAATSPDGLDADSH